MKSSFFLVIPEQKQDPQLLAWFTDANLAKWIDELPTANPGLSTRLFQEMFTELLALEMPSAKRLNALELLKPHFLGLEDYLRAKLMQSGFPKGENEKKIFNILVILEKQLAIGYWSVVRELTRKEVNWLQGKTVALAIQRTIEGLSSIVITYYMMSHPIPNWIWIDLHSLYKLSVKLGRVSTKVADQRSLLFGGKSVEDRYKQIILLSLSYPSGLMQKEFLQVYHFTEKLSEFVQIEFKPVVDQEVQCTISLDEDLPPAFSLTDHSFDFKNIDPSKVYLNLAKLYKALKQIDKFASKDEVRFSSLEGRKSSDPHQKLSAELFDYLYHRWHGKEPQGTALFSDRLDRYIAIGLASTHELQDLTFPETGFRELEALAQTYSDQALICNFTDKEGWLSIGSLVSFRQTTSQRHVRTLGVVCKIILPKQDSNLIFELTVLAAQSFSVTYQNMYDDPDSERKKALLYGIKTNNEERSFIILESFMIKDGDILKMHMGQESFPIILIGRKNIGLGYWQFECRRVLEDDFLSAPDKKKGYDFI